MCPCEPNLRLCICTKGAAEPLFTKIHTNEGERALGALDGTLQHIPQCFNHYFSGTAAALVILRALHWLRFKVLFELLGLIPENNTVLHSTGEISTLLTDFDYFYPIYGGAACFLALLVTGPFNIWKNTILIIILYCDYQLSLLRYPYNLENLQVFKDFSVNVIFSL